jgi:hypothetical protein
VRLGLTRYERHYMYYIAFAALVCNCSDEC